MSKNAEKIIKKSNLTIIKPHIFWTFILFTYTFLYRRNISFIPLFVVAIDVLCKMYLVACFLQNINLKSPGFSGVMFDLILMNYLVGFFSYYSKYVTLLYFLVVYSVYYEYKSVFFIFN